MATNTSYNFKVVLLGEGCVGKTSLLLRFTEQKFSDTHVTTLQATFLNKKLNINDKRVNLSIWDTAGQEKFHALGPIYYRGSQGAVLVYDITDSDSFLKVKTWVKELKKMLGSDIALIIAGNKMDLEHERTIPFEEAESYAHMVGATHIYTSAKQNYGVEETFLELTNQMMVKHDKSLLNEKNVNRSPGLIIVDDEPQQSGTQCCLGFSRHSSTQNNS